VYEILECCGSVIVVFECCGSVMNMYGVLKNCGNVIVVCEYNESEWMCMGINVRRVSVVVEWRERN
jgi:hypothetical protein